MIREILEAIRRKKAQAPAGQALAAFVPGRGTLEASKFLHEMIPEFPGIEFVHGDRGWTISAPAGTDRARFDQMVARVRELEGAGT